LRTDCAHKAEAGFTLIEILVAFAILGLVAAAVLSVFSSGPGRIVHAENQRLAVLTVKSLLAEVGAGRAIEAGGWEGDTRDGGRWKLVMAPYAGASSDPDHPPPLQPYLVTVHATSGPAWSGATADLETVRLRMPEP
jgi:general secretion pathway protein I